MRRDNGPTPLDLLGVEGGITGPESGCRHPTLAHRCWRLPQMPIML